MLVYQRAIECLTDCDCVEFTCYAQISWLLLPCPDLGISFVPRCFLGGLMFQQATTIEKRSTPSEEDRFHYWL